MDSRSQEVDIKELVYGILKEWRLLLGAGCICAAALGGYKAAGSLALSKSPEYEASKAAEYGEALLAYETEKKGLEREIGDILQGMQAQQIYLDAMEEGLIRTFIEAGAIVSTPTCGPCLGGYMGILAEGERCVSTTNRNFVGRMGHVESEIYLASPAVAAASAISGKISGPNE